MNGAGKNLTGQIKKNQWSYKTITQIYKYSMEQIEFIANARLAKNTNKTNKCTYKLHSVKPAQTLILCGFYGIIVGRKALKKRGRMYEKEIAIFAERIAFTKEIIKVDTSDFGNLMTERNEADKVALKLLIEAQQRECISKSPLNKHEEYVVKFANNHNLSIADAHHQPMVKAHLHAFNSGLMGGV